MAPTSFKRTSSLQRLDTDGVHLTMNEHIERQSYPESVSGVRLLYETHDIAPSQTNPKTLAANTRIMTLEKNTGSVQRTRRKSIIRCSRRILEAMVGGVLLLSALSMTQYNAEEWRSLTPVQRSDTGNSPVAVYSGLTLYLKLMAQQTENILNLPFTAHPITILTHPATLDFTIASFIYNICLLTLHNLHFIPLGGHLITRIIYIIGSLVALGCAWLEAAGVQGFLSIAEMLFFGVAVVAVGDWVVCLLGNLRWAGCGGEGRLRRVSPDGEKSGVV